MNFNAKHICSVTSILVNTFQKYVNMIQNITIKRMQLGCHLIPRKLTFNLIPYYMIQDIDVRYARKKQK